MEGGKVITTKKIKLIKLQQQFLKAKITKKVHSHVHRHYVGGFTVFADTNQ